MENNEMKSSETETRCAYRCVLSGPNARPCNERSGGGYLCTRPAGHDGPHAACGPYAHPAIRWPRDGDGFRADPPVIDAAMHVLHNLEERGAA